MGRKFNAAYYVTDILSPLSKWRSASAKADKRKLIIHADNASPHIAQLSAQFFEQNKMNTAPHPPYSPGLAPSDFYLFGYVKGCLAGLSFESTDGLL
jgi:histone-lysine N-methyltransferase SETMAR